MNKVSFSSLGHVVGYYWLEKHKPAIYWTKKKKKKKELMDGVKGRSVYFPQFRVLIKAKKERSDLIKIYPYTTILPNHTTKGPFPSTLQTI